MRLLFVLIAALAFTHAARSQDSGQADLPATPLFERETITGEWFGKRPIIEDRGVSLFGSYTAEVWGNTTGGLRTGSVYTGLLDFGAEVDLEKLVNWRGASLGTSWLWLSGRDASEDLVGNFLTVSNIAGFNTLRMMELWFQQNFPPLRKYHGGFGVSRFGLRRAVYQRRVWLACSGLDEHGRWRCGLPGRRTRSAR